MSLTRIFIVSITLLCLFGSCKKDDIPGLGDKLLLRVISNAGDSIVYTSFHYDTQNRLISIKDSCNDASHHTWETYIDYNTEGNPIKFKTVDDYLHVLLETTDSLIYENDKVIKKIRTQSSNFYQYTSSYQSIQTYSYDTKGRLIPGNPTYSSFIYDDNDDLVQIDELFYTPDTIINWPRRRTTALYNTHENPYNKLGLLYYFMTDRYELLSKHNKTEVIYEEPNQPLVTEKYTYEYEDGLPTKMVLKRGEEDFPYGTTTIDFYYN